MARKLKSDRLLFLTTILLVGLSIVMVYSASAVVTLERYGRPSMFLIKQSMWALLGIANLGVFMRIDYRTYRQPVFIWTALVVVVAALLERRMHRIDEVAYSLLPIGMVVTLLVGLILLEPDFGTSMSLVLIALVMVFAAGLDYRYIAGAALTAFPALYILVMGSAYRRRRMFSFLNPWEDPLGDGFQIIQSLIAVGTGGIWGKGLMNGVQKLFYLPEPHTDFIYSVIAEELGLVGASIVLVCFCVVTWRGLRVTLRAPDSFAALLALGLTTMVAIQAFENISVVLGMMPTKGIPLPFVSAGGSSLLINLVGMGILLNVSQHVNPAEG